MKNNLRLNFMAMIGVRIDDETDKVISAMAAKKCLSKSDFIRSMLIRGMEAENINGEVINEIFENLLTNAATTEKTFKITAQILALTLRILNNINSEEVLAAKEDARKILEKNGSVA